MEFKCLGDESFARNLQTADIEAKWQLKLQENSWSQLIRNRATANN